MVPHIPEDIIYLIVAALRSQPSAPDRRLAPYATINRAWNAIVEHSIFRGPLHVTSSTLPLFAQALGTARTDTASNNPDDRWRDEQRRRRREALRSISLQIELPHACADDGRIAPDLQAENDRAFTKAIDSFFGVLASWSGHGASSSDEKAPPPQPHLKLSLQLVGGPREVCAVKPAWIAFARDQLPAGERFEDEYMDRLEGMDDVDAPYVRYITAAVAGADRCKMRDDEEEELLPPAVRCIRSFSIRDVDGHAQIWPPSLMRIIAAMDGLQECDLELDDTEVVNPRVRMEYREALATHLHRLPRTCTALRADFRHDTNGYSIQPALRPSHGPDTLCIALRILSTQHLTTLTLANLRISPTLFWPPAADPPAAPPRWPHLRDLDVSFALAAPCGDWYAHQEPQEEAEMEHWLGRYDGPDSVNRPVPDRDAVNGVLGAAGWAVRCGMPVARSVSVRLEHRNCLTCGVEFYYCDSPSRRDRVAGRGRGGESESVNAFVVQWEWDWHHRFSLSDETLDAWGVKKEDAYWSESWVETVVTWRSSESTDRVSS